jgi:hypothetical protein
VTQSKQEGRALGALLLIHFALGLMVPYMLLHPVTRAGGAFIESAAAMDGTIRLCMLMLLLGSACALVIAIRIWDMVGDQKRLGLLVVALAVVSFTLQLLEIAHWLSLLSISQAYASADPASAATFHTWAPAAYAIFRWVHYSHIFLAVLWLLSLYLAFYRTAAVPRLLSAAAMLCVPLHLIGIIVPVFAGYRMSNPDLFGAPLGVATFIIALWLMVKGSGSRMALSLPARDQGIDDARVG